eukprot:jgi/Picsp_1/3863/NSC_01375-R1_metalloprotease
MRATLSSILTRVCVTLTLVATFVGGQKGTDWSCGTKSTKEAVELILSSQREIYGRAMYETSNSSERALVTGRARFPQGVEIKVRVVNCAGSMLKGFTRSLRKLNDGFHESKIRFGLDKIVDCSFTEAKKLDKYCTDAYSKNNKCPDVLRSISRRIGYNRGILVIVMNEPAYRVLGQADLGLIPSDPWIMVQATTLPDVSPSSNARTAAKSTQIENNGYTLVHEIGHAFGLLHTFENGCKAPGDYIPDTPYQSDALSRLPEFLPTLQCCVLHPTAKCATPSTCEKATGSNFDNFMDYSPDSCKKRFTPGQIAAMYATLLARRPEWLGKSKKYMPLQDIAIFQDIGEKVNTIQGMFKGNDDIVDPERFQGCPDDSLWRNEYQKNSLGVLGQPSKVVYQLNVPRSSESIQINKCKSSSEEATIALTYLECEEDSTCTCQMFQCIPDQETKINIKTSRALGETNEKTKYVIVTNDARSEKEISFTLDALVKLKQNQPPPQNVPASPIQAAKKCRYSGIYNVYVPRGACKYRYLSSPVDCEATTARLKSKKQLKAAMSTAYWAMQINALMDEKKRSSTTLLNYGRTNCPSKYLAATKSSPSMGIETWKWRIIPSSNSSCKKVRLVVDNGSYKNQYVRVTKNCDLAFTKRKASSQIFGMKDMYGKAPKPMFV